MSEKFYPLSAFQPVAFHETEAFAVRREVLARAFKGFSITDPNEKFGLIGRSLKDLMSLPKRVRRASAFAMNKNLFMFHAFMATLDSPACLEASFLGQLTPLHRIAA